MKEMYNLYPIYKQVRHDATYYVGICFKRSVIDFMNEEDK